MVPLDDHAFQEDHQLQRDLEERGGQQLLADPTEEAPGCP